MYIIGIDVGGTFTDTVAIDCESPSFAQGVFRGKASTTPENLTVGVLNSLEDVAKQMGFV
jgi:N-methylhydantoinase A/oxoprolinase/acetone carboxylase beta subunit